MKFICATPHFSELSRILKNWLIMSHGQAQVEWGFSINSKLFVENLDSFIAQDIVHDYMNFNKLSLTTFQ